MKWVIYVIIFIYMLFRAVYGAKDVNTVFIDDNEVLFLEAGDKKTITCGVSGKNSKIDWYDPDGEVVLHENTNRIFSQKHLTRLRNGSRVPALLLTISKAEVDDSGKYQCRSEKMTRDIELCVIDPSDFVDTPTEYFVDEGRSFTLTCEARGNPEPRLMWSRDGINIIEDNTNSSKYKVATKYNLQGFEGHLTITSLQRDDSGIYTCIAIQENVMVDECGMSKALNISLQINYPPTFVNGNDTQFVFAKFNESLELVCAANAFPKPTYRWFHDAGDNTLFEYPTQQIIVSEDGSEAKLPMIANSITFGQKFTCRVTNSLGDSLKIFNVLKLEKPLTPSEVQLEYQGSDELVFNFTSDNEIDFPIDKMEAQYFIAYGSPAKKKALKDKDAEWRRAKLRKLEAIDDDGESYKLKDLDFDTEYWMRFRATNDLGTSPWSKPLFASTTPESTTTTTEGTTDTTDSEELNEEELVEKVYGALLSQKDAAFYAVAFIEAVVILVLICVIVMKKKS